MTTLTETTEESKVEEVNANMGTENNDAEEINLGEMKTIDVGEGFTKPLLEGLTDATVKKVALFKASRKDNDKAGKEFTPLYLQVTCGLGEDKETVDNYGGIKKYEEDGKVRYYAGPDCAYGKLKQLVKDTYKVEQLAEIASTITDKKCRLKTEVKEFAGKKYPKNVIQQFL